MSESAALKPHILAVDDDPSIRELLQTYLTDRDMHVTAVANERDMQAVLDREAVDLLLLDLRLAGTDGMQIARRLRDRSTMPIIILTANRDEADRVMGLELGADDYLTKPFSPRELLARIRALLRRSNMHAQGNAATKAATTVRHYRFAGWVLNVRLRQLKDPDGQPVALRNSEFNLLLAFLAAPGQVLGRDRLIELSRLHSDEVFDRAVDVQVGRLRRKLQRADAPDDRLIATERGAGYVFTAPVTASHD
jgi:two-component system OmpR family response regulator